MNYFLLEPFLVVAFLIFYFLFMSEWVIIYLRCHIILFLIISWVEFVLLGLLYCPGILLVYHNFDVSRPVIIETRSLRM